VTHAIWKAWIQVKSNRGAAGIDKESIEQSEAKLNRLRDHSRDSAKALFGDNLFA